MQYNCENVCGKRLDVAITLLNSDLTRSTAQKLINSNNILVNNKNKSASYKVQSCDIINIEIPMVKEYDAVAQNIPIDIIYQDDDVAVIFKPKGMVVHPACGHEDGTLVNAIMYHIKDLSGIGGVIRPGIVHRLDKDTSGLILIAKNDKAHNFLSEQLKDKTMNRRYYAICKGNFNNESFIVEKNIDRHKNDRKKMSVCDSSSGRYAKTEFFVIKQVQGYSLLECKLYTGRTHQIRVHLSSIGHAIVGDEVYGKKGKINFSGQALFAFRLEFIHPTTKEKMCFQAEKPQEFLDLERKIFKQI